jgi:hypothetical protein
MLIAFMGLHTEKGGICAQCDLEHEEQWAVDIEQWAVNSEQTVE